MSWWLEEMAVSQLPAGEREREREREREGGGGGGGRGSAYTHTETRDYCNTLSFTHTHCETQKDIHAHIPSFSLTHTPSHTQTNKHTSILMTHHPLSHTNMFSGVSLSDPSSLIVGCCSLHLFQFHPHCLPSLETPTASLIVWLAW